LEKSAKEKSGSKIVKSIETVGWNL
jgi:hypothetical protein